MSLGNVKVFGQNSIKIKYNNKNIYIDPLYIDENYNDADYVFITHDHYDHFSPEDIAKVTYDNTRIVMPEKMRDKLSKVNIKIENSLFVIPDETYKIEDIEFKTTYSYNKLKPFHPKLNKWVGYILDLEQKYYIAGDTDNVPELQDIKCDVAFVPVGGTYTMNYKEGAALINSIKPQIAVPVHYGSIVGDKEDGKRFIELVDDGIECKIMF